MAMLRIFWPLLLVTILLGAACSDDGPGRPGPGLTDPAGDFILIPAGTFVMGSPEDEPGRTNIEIQHEVTLSNAFWLKATEVTNEEYRQMAQWALGHGLAEVTGDPDKVLRDRNGSANILCALNADGSEIGYDADGDSLILRNAGFGLNPEHPAKHLTWWGAATYCDWLSLFEGRKPAYDHKTWTVQAYATSGYRLPTEAEWEYAARGGTTTAFGGSQIQDTGCGPDSLSLQGWYCANADDWTRPVATLEPNAYGLYDMHGNAWEFCNDWFASNYYADSPTIDPTGPNGVFARVARGGAWGTTARYCRSSMRGFHWLGMTSSREGLRPLLLR